MEPANIDWNSVESRFVRDELLEGFNAPKWVDLSSPHPFNPGDDDAWFCRPDCRHPKTYEDFLQNSPPTPDTKARRKVLGERNPNRGSTVKRIGALPPSMIPLTSSPRAKPAVMKKKAREEVADLENQNPNLPPSALIKKASNLAKEAVKSSAEKPRNVVKAEPQRQLKSTYPARNLFAGKEIFAQISEFCGEIRRMATSKRERTECGCRQDYGKIESESDEVGKKVGILKEKTQFRKEELEKGKKGEENTKKGTGESLRLLQQEVRSCPPTPQRFPSPMCKLNGAPPLKPSRAASPERIILKELVLDKNECKEVVEQKTDEGCSISGNSAVEELKTLNMFWLFKPCTYLGR